MAGEKQLLSVIKSLLDAQRTDKEGAYQIDTATPGITFLGFCKTGESLNTDLPLWAIKKIDETVANKVTITWASGTRDYIHIFDNRTLLTYR